MKILKKHGVKIYVCSQALAQKEYDPREVAEGVVIAASVATVIINKQMEGYAYIPFH